MRIGTDIVECERIQSMLKRYPHQFPSNVLTAEEMALLPERLQARITFVAGRWAAKEAVAKALGCGFGADCSWKELSVTNLPGGEPVVELRGSALATAQRLGYKAIHISISHEKHYATAVALLE